MKILPVKNIVKIYSTKLPKLSFLIIYTEVVLSFVCIKLALLYRHTTVTKTVTVIETGSVTIERNGNVTKMKDATVTFYFY